MKRLIALICLAAVATEMSVAAKEPPKPHPTVSCSPSDTMEEEAKKKVHYFVDGKEHIEYCFGGKKHIIIDSGDNG